LILGWLGVSEGEEIDRDDEDRRMFLEALEDA
jgi:hypothetical protein